jgi:hypothetical protein
MSALNGEPALASVWGVLLKGELPKRKTRSRDHGRGRNEVQIHRNIVLRCFKQKTACMMGRCWHVLYATAGASGRLRQTWVVSPGRYVRVGIYENHNLLLVAEHRARIKISSKTVFTNASISCFPLLQMP